MIDASAMVEALVGRDPDAELLDAVAGDLDAPELLDVEVMSALRGLELGGKLDASVAADALREYFAFTITRHEVPLLADRIWALRQQYSCYDACYMALAEALAAPLYTCDAKLARSAHGIDARVCASTR